MQTLRRKRGYVLGNHCFRGQRQYLSLLYNEGILLQISEGTSL